MSNTESQEYSEFRNKSKNILKETFQGEIKTSLKIEKIIDKLSSNDLKLYKKILYQVLQDKNTLPSKNILENLEKGKILWNQSIFETIKKHIEEQDDFIVNPYEVEIGVLKCRNCGSEKILTRSKQTRSSDEATSSICKCTNCKANWVYSG